MQGIQAPLTRDPTGDGAGILPGNGSGAGFSGKTPGVCLRAEAAIPPTRVTEMCSRSQFSLDAGQSGKLPESIDRQPP
jgi:hypothetical protein